jgi:hypothetical protein
MPLQLLQSQVDILIAKKKELLPEIRNIGCQFIQVKDDDLIDVNVIRDIINRLNTNFIEKISLLDNQIKKLENDIEIISNHQKLLILNIIPQSMKNFLCGNEVNDMYLFDSDDFEEKENKSIIFRWIIPNDHGEYNVIHTEYTRLILEEYFQRNCFSRINKVNNKIFLDIRIETEKDQIRLKFSTHTILNSILYDDVKEKMKFYQYIELIKENPHDLIVYSCHFSDQIVDNFNVLDYKNETITKSDMFNYPKISIAWTENDISIICFRVTPKNGVPWKHPKTFQMMYCKGKSPSKVIQQILINYFESLGQYHYLTKTITVDHLPCDGYYDHHRINKMDANPYNYSNDPNQPDENFGRQYEEIRVFIPTQLLTNTKKN